MFRYFKFAVLFFIGLSSVLLASMLEQAFEAHRNGNLARAEGYYFKALEAGENRAIVHYNLANLYYAQDKLGDAVLNYKRAIEFAPTFKDAYLNLGRIYYIFGEYQRALEAFESYKKQNPDDYDNNLLLADTYKRIRMFPHALDAYQQAVREKPYHEEGYIALADFFLDFDDTDTALRMAVEGFDNAGFSKSLLLYEADLLRESERYDEAVSVYQSLLLDKKVTNLSVGEKYDIQLKVVDALLSASNVNYALFELEKVVEKYPQKEIGIGYLENVYIVYDKVSRGFSFFKAFYGRNPKAARVAIKNFLAVAYNQDNLYLVRVIVDFFESQDIRDDLVQAISEDLGYPKK